MVIKIIEDLIYLFISQKINKDVLIKILNIYKISHTEFNNQVIDKLRERESRPVLNISTLLDDTFIKEVKKQDIKSVDLSKYELESLYKSSKFITYKMSRRFLTVEELRIKMDQYLKCMGVSGRSDIDTSEYLHKGLERYIKNLIDKCDKVDVKNIKKKMGKDKNILNIYP
ncbi:hypothetical protein P3W45_000543 [Vairimorpha bombi]|jgi:hypothetical protein